MNVTNRKTLRGRTSASHAVALVTAESGGPGGRWRAQAIIGLGDTLCFVAGLLSLAVSARAAIRGTGRGRYSKLGAPPTPDLISGEFSARALLERVKAEKAKQKPAAETVTT